MAMELIEIVGYFLPILLTFGLILYIWMKKNKKHYDMYAKKGAYVPLAIAFIIAFIAWFLIYMLFPDIEIMFKGLLG